MRLLLDTHVVLWQLSGERELSQSAVAAIAAADDLLFSVVSFAEIGIKAAAGKLVVPPDLKAKITDAGVRSLALAAAHGLAVAQLPAHHGDPLDRLLIAQAMTEGLTLVTADANFAAYGVPIVAA
ncbi:MAG: type II toxin-antitoxin system VapC family toxin [Actinomycetales bacterium]|jgi:PIN domain nuclease of toxin-antitoxin system|nr:type II toxin-antitoxin system VapC family toxin [Candidatus Phosphoribacter baldrii]HRC12146.1 type II toxin-antitoxin system VapC family toxin [Dermatophilaceae bacterium]